MSDYERIMSGEPVSASAWLDESQPAVDGDEAVTIHAELTDVDEVALRLLDENDGDIVIIHLPRVQAIALAGQIAWAATADQGRLPSGHGPTGPCVS